MQRKIRVGAVSYLNTKPLVYGFEHGMMADSVDLNIDFPSKIASMLLEDKIDVGLVPVAIIPEMKEHYIISNYCISCDGAVASVCLFSEVPLDKIEKILLDYQSRTSVELLKILIKESWKIDPVIEETTGEYRSQISGTTAALVIGDRALEQRKVSPYIYDLGLEWKKFTGLPFVFAAWVSNKKLDTDFIDSFNEANSAGLHKIETIVEENPFSEFNLIDYYTKYISFELNDAKEKALGLFLNKISSGTLLVN
ncbi:menaquinone biosynthesis protein [Ginsengibacter hankyongi]|uniref:Chorismate dehydratase n=1 Tax=Ginsengibacter hankyongi TaxID=2607284 RepID=A0A5J5IJ05_9BACT|nr:menaquinone biosynthesis protein [Ginsengibacter hankyongi]KAA9041020.1 menaquinone biosynthesis protein [Ginsengibacter hankyongi]